MHDTRRGRASVDALWWAKGATLIRLTGLNASDELIVLKPDESVFWYGAGIGALNYPSDFHDFIRDGTVRVRRNDINHLEKDTIVFDDGERLETDATICVTGWEWRGSIDFLSPETHAKLGVPSAKYTPSQQEKWDALDRRVDREILHRFPWLATIFTKDFSREDFLVARPSVGTRKRFDITTEADSAEDKTSKQKYSPWRLWRDMVPSGQACTEERNLVFLGVVNNVHAALQCEISSLWAYAWLNERLDEPVGALSESKSNIVSEDRHQRDCKTLSRGCSSTTGGDIYYETALMSRFGHWRYPYGYGERASPISSSILFPTWTC